jgi:uncharacterized protein (TIGR02246 family)
VTAESKRLVETEIRRVMDEQENAVRARNVEGVMSNCAPDVVSFDVVGGLQRIGTDERRKRAEEWFSSFQGRIIYEVRDLSITAADNVAFCHSLNHVNGIRRDGQEIDMWWRATVCFQRIEGRWLIKHEHSSVPFDTTSGKAQLDLKP